MPALMQPRLVKIASTGAKSNVKETKCTRETAAGKKAGKGFLAALLSALSAPGA